MAATPGLLAQIEAGVLDNSMPQSSRAGIAQGRVASPPTGQPGNWVQVFRPGVPRGLGRRLEPRV